MNSSPQNGFSALLYFLINQMTKSMQRHQRRRQWAFHFVPPVCLIHSLPQWYSLTWNQSRILPRSLGGDRFHTTLFLSEDLLPSLLKLQCLKATYYHIKVDHPQIGMSCDTRAPPPPIPMPCIHNYLPHDSYSFYLWLLVIVLARWVNKLAR